MYSVSLLCSIGSHSTSDDQTGYQDMQEVAHWKEFNDPVDRLQRYMENRGIWTEVCGHGYVHGELGDMGRVMWVCTWRTGGYGQRYVAMGMCMENWGIWVE